LLEVEFMVNLSLKFKNVTKECIALEVLGTKF
jgi:hypothetical protein